MMSRVQNGRLIGCSKMSKKLSRHRIDFSEQGCLEGWQVWEKRLVVEEGWQILEERLGVEEGWQVWQEQLVGGS